MRENTTIHVVGCCLILLNILAYAAVVVGLAWIIIHFARKLW